MLNNAIIAAAMLTLASCGSGKTAEGGADSVQEVGLAAFDGQAALADVRRQVEFGPRVPGTAAHARCADWIDSTLRAGGADTVIVQTATVDDHRGGTMPVRNSLAASMPAPQNASCCWHITTRAHGPTRTLTRQTTASPSTEPMTAAAVWRC